MELEPYLEQRRHWPQQGRTVLAHYDERAIVVYQAFKPQIADEAVQLGRFGPSFSRSRMSWIKPNFLWMMFRCGWATKVDQERVLALWLPRTFFERLAAAAVPSTFDPTAWRDENAWKGAVAGSTPAATGGYRSTNGNKPSGSSTGDEARCAASAAVRRCVGLGMDRTVLNDPECQPGLLQLAPRRRAGVGLADCLAAYLAGGLATSAGRKPEL